jgi:tRNA (guanine-N7-)-methyltransferase
MKKDQSHKILKHQKLNQCYQADFTYKSKNPYQDKLKIFNSFVLQNNVAENYQGKWCSEVFKTQAPLMVEVGTGYGHFMHQYCLDHPEHLFVGLDYRFKRSFNLAQKLAQIENKNFRYLRAMGERLHYIFGAKEVDRIFYFFPDPWPKTRHHKKRLFQLPFLKACHQVLKDQGELWVKTDHDQYFEWMLEVVADQALFTVEFQSFDLHLEHPTHFLARYPTKFEKIFMAQKITTKAMILRKLQ